MKTGEEIKEDYYAGSKRQPSQLCDVCKNPVTHDRKLTCIAVVSRSR